MLNEEYEELLIYFVKWFSELYGAKNISHNVHGLIHLADDAKVFGSLDNFSAFKFENYMKTLKTFVGKCNMPLQQIYKQIDDDEVIGIDDNILRNILIRK